MDYTRYFSLLGEIKEAGYKIEEEKKHLHKEVVRENRLVFWVFDIAIVLAIVFNLGAMMITNAMVLREEPQAVFMEANPIASKISGYQQHPEGGQVLKTIYFRVLVWVLLIGGYLHTRFYTFNQRGVNRLAFIVLFLFMMLLYDFLHDAGFYIGKIIWGI